MFRSLSTSGIGMSGTMGSGLPVGTHPNFKNVGSGFQANWAEVGSGFQVGTQKVGSDVFQVSGRNPKSGFQWVPGKLG